MMWKPSSRRDFLRLEMVILKDERSADRPTSRSDVYVEGETAQDLSLHFHLEVDFRDGVRFG